MRDKVRYRKLRNKIVEVAIRKIKFHSETKDQEAEFVFLLFDLVSCPYITESKKVKALEMYGVSDRGLA